MSANRKPRDICLRVPSISQANTPIDKECKDEDGIGLVSQAVVEKAYRKAVTQIDRKRMVVYRWKKEFQRRRGDGVEDRTNRIYTQDGAGESPARAKIPPGSQNQDYRL